MPLSFKFAGKLSVIGNYLRLNGYVLWDSVGLVNQLDGLAKDKRCLPVLRSIGSVTRRYLLSRRRLIDLDLEWGSMAALSRTTCCSGPVIELVPIIDHLFLFFLCCCSLSICSILASWLHHSIVQLV